MNLQEYISSGIIESYVLGLASPEESVEFERLCASNSELRAARENFELTLEQSLQSQQLQPPRELKSRIFSEIGMEKNTKPPATSTSFRKPAMVPRIGFAKYVAAASLVLLAGSVLLNLYLLDQYKKSIAQYKELAATQTGLAGSNQILQTKLQEYENVLGQIKNPLNEIIKLPSVPSSPAPFSMATLYWNTDSREVYLLVNQLPKPVADKQYQLWAIVDGKPVSAGVFDVNEGISFVKLRTIPKADAFAITLEKKGGSVAPTMSAMYVMGKVNS